MTDNNGKALREAKAYLARQAWSDKWAELHPNDPAVLLAALVEAVDGGILTCVTSDTGAGAIYDKRLTQPGQRVRVLAVGEDG